ncbi:galactose oxidase [Pseudoscourfieldia marina]
MAGPPSHSDDNTATQSSCRWVRLAFMGPQPAARSSHGLSAISDGTLILMGGEGANARSPLGCTIWTLSGESVAANTRDDADLSVDELGQWRMLDDAAFSTMPPPRVGHAQAAIDNTVYVFGGRDAVAVGDGGLNDMWAFHANEGRWEKRDMNTPPHARSYHAMCAADEAKTLYTFGGCGESGRLADLWATDTRASSWEELPAAPIRGRGGPCLFTSPDGKTVMVVAGFAGEETNDVALFDRVAGKWRSTELESLRKRSVAAHFYDPCSRRCMIFGGEVDPSNIGHAGAGDFASDMVSFDLDGNLLAPPSVTGTPAGSAEARGWGAMAASAASGRTVAVMFGGLAGNDENPKRLDDTWALVVR